jgi:hypothetical protein
MMCRERGVDAASDHIVLPLSYAQEAKDINGVVQSGVCNNMQVVIDVDIEKR